MEYQHNEPSDSLEDENTGTFWIWSEPARSWTVEIGLRLSQFLLIFGGVVPYIPQYIEILRTKDSTGFSPFVCLAIVMSSSLRICYWFGIDYDFAIFLQSIVMLIVMFGMLELCIRVKDPPRLERAFLDFDITYFWAWTNILSFIQVTVVFIANVVFIVLVFGWIPGVMPIISILTLLLEAGLALPQFLRNWINSSTHGLNKAMVCFWAFGDMYKLLYYILRDVPIPFIICVIFQLFLDLAILCQIFFYGDHSTQHYQLNDFAH